MKTHPSTVSSPVYSRSHYKAAGVLLAALIGVSIASAQTNWVGNTSADLNVVGNWSGVLPSSAVYSVFTSAGTSGTNLSLTSNLQFGGGTAGTGTGSNAMLFNGAGFTISGNNSTRELTIGGQGVAIDTTNTITFDVARIRRNASNTFEFLGSSGNLVINSEFSTNVTGADNLTRVDFTGTGGNNNTITFNGNIVKVFSGTTPGAGVGNLLISSVGTGNRVVFNNASNTGFAGSVSVGNNARLQLGSGGANGTLSGTTSISLGNSASRFIIEQNDTVTQGMEFASSITGLGVVVQQGSGTTILNADNSFSGGVQVTAGTLLVSNTTGSGTGSGLVTVSSLAAVGGNGTIGGSLTLNTNAQFSFDPASTLKVTGTVTLPTSFGIDDLLGLSSSTAFGTYTIFDSATSVSYTSIANVGIENLAFLGGDRNAYFQFSDGGTNLQVVVASVIPEPSAFAVLAGLGALGFSATRRRRRAA
jgi:autotransporter-associated beta strand protein